MYKSDAIKFFQQMRPWRGGASNLAEILGISRQAVHLWPETLSPMAEAKVLAAQALMQGMEPLSNGAWRVERKPRGGNGAS